MPFFHCADRSPTSPPLASPPNADAALRPDDDDGDDAVSVLADLSPWAISITLHAAMVIMAIFLVWITIPQIADDPIVPSVYKGRKVAPQNRLRAASKSALPTRDSARRNPNPIKTTDVRELLSTMHVKTQLLGIRCGPTSKATPFGAVGVGHSLDVFGNTDGTGNARKVAYLVDASGSLIDTFPFVLAELRRSIGELDESIRFTVIFFQGDGAIEAQPPGLKAATARNKQRVIEWLRPFVGDSHSGNTSGGNATSGGSATSGVGVGAVTPGGASNPVRALKQALRYRPDLVFLLSDNITGQGPYEVNQQALLDEIRKANVAGARINTLQFLYPDPLTKYGFKPTMELIAAQSGGKAKFVSAAELAIQ